MVLRGVELGEIVVRLLNLRAVHNLKAHVQEDFLHLVQHGIHGVLVAHDGLFAGNGHVHGLRRQPGLQGLPGEDAGLGLDGLLQAGADVVGQLAHDGAELGGQSAHLLQNGGELALLAQVLDPEGLQPGGFLGGGDGLQGPPADGF